MKRNNLNLCVSEAAAIQVQPRKKSEQTFASKFRLFFSKRYKKEKCKTTIDKRSKSCDRELEESCKKEDKTPAIRSASCSPLKQREREAARTPVASCLSLAPTEWEFHLQDAINGNNTSITSNTAKISGDRKSSGYDSLEGESSSIDSNQEVSQSQGNTLNYAVPTDNKSINSAMQYDDISVLKNEIRRYPNILRRAY